MTVTRPLRRGPSGPESLERRKEVRTDTHVRKRAAGRTQLNRRRNRIMKIAITMPTGKVGTRLVDELLDRGGHELTLLARDANKVRKAAGRGARVAKGKLEDVEFVARATRGMDALFFVLPMDSHSRDVFRNATRVTESVCDAIRKNEIPRVVFVSSIGTQLEKGTGPVGYLREAERKLAKVSPNLTVLRPALYMDQFMGWMKQIANENAIYSSVPPGTGIPFVAARDISRFAADVLTDSRWTGRRNFSLHGPREYSHEDIAKLMSEKLGLKIRYVQLEPTKMADKLRGRGWSEEAVSSNLELLRSLAEGRISDEAPRSEWKLQPTSLDDFLTRDLQPAFDRLAAVTA
jgi:uncharacterized protein YbjT (DUF2867 family)